MALQQHISRPSMTGVGLRSVSPATGAGSLTAPPGRSPGLGPSRSQNIVVPNCGLGIPYARQPSPCPGASREVVVRRPSASWAGLGKSRLLQGVASPAPPGQGTPLPFSALSSTGENQALSVPMLHFGYQHPDSVQPNEELSKSTKRTNPAHAPQDLVTFRTKDHSSLPSPGLDAEKLQTMSQDQTPLTFLANQFVESIQSFEKQFTETRQASGSDGQGSPLLNCVDLRSAFRSALTDSPALQSVYPSDDGSENKSPSDKQGCSTIRSDESLTSDQLRAYKELEQAEMACELKRMENCLAEERERAANLQQTFATELMAQKDAHSRDVSALEDMIGKVLAENRRLSTMVEGLCGQAEQGGIARKAPRSPDRLSTCSSGTTRSKRSPMQSGSSGDGSSHSPHSVSSEAEHTTDSERIPSSDEAPLVHEQVWQPTKPRIYVNID